MTILLENMICVSHKFGYNPDAIRLLGQYLFDMPTESNNDVSITLEHWGSGIIYKQLRMSKKSTISDIKKILDDYILLENDRKDDVKLEDFNKDEITFVIGKNIDDFLYLKELKKMRKKKKKFFSIYAMNDCVRKGYLNCLKYLHENGCRWDSTTCSTAALNGHLDCLKYAHENGCSWDSDTCWSAAFKGHLDCLKYAIENDCPYNKQKCINEAKKNNHEEIIDYLESI